MLHDNREADSVREAVYVGVDIETESTVATVAYGRLTDGEMMRVEGMRPIDLDNVR